VSADVVRIITRLNIGGPARQALLLTEALRPEFSTVLAAGMPAPEEGELTDERVSVHRLPLVRRLELRTDPRAFLAARRLLVSERPRILHTHMAKAGAIGRGAALTMRKRPRLVHTFHGHVLDGYFRPAVERAFIATERFLAKRTDVLVAVSEEVREKLLSLGVGRPEQWRVIRLGLDLDPFLRATGRTGVLRASLGIGHDVPLLGVVGRLVPIKDQSSLFVSMERLPDAHLVVIGDGESRAALEGKARSGAAAERIHFTGWRHDLADSLRDLDVVALSSINEGTPVALIEALAAGVPVVATDVGGVAAVVDDPRLGVLVPPSDPVAMADGLRRVLSERSSIDREMRDRIGLRFGRERLLEEMRALYRELVAD
jgi:glycosyltransferase involved in cell wall biosynthesis